MACGEAHLGEAGPLDVDDGPHHGRDIPACRHICFDKAGDDGVLANVADVQQGQHLYVCTRVYTRVRSGASVFCMSVHCHKHLAPRVLVCFERTKALALTALIPQKTRPCMREIIQGSAQCHPGRLHTLTPRP